MAEWYDEAAKYRGKNDSPNLGGADRICDVPVSRPFVKPPNTSDFNSRWQPRPRGGAKKK